MSDPWDRPPFHDDSEAQLALRSDPVSRSILDDDARTWLGSAALTRGLGFYLFQLNGWAQLPAD